MYAILADLVVLTRLGFIAFVAFGGLLVIRWPRVSFAHLPAAIWGTLIELTGGVCPLTPFENLLREMGGQAPYRGDFIGTYILPIIYPADLTRQFQYILAAVVIVSNLAIYGCVILRRSRP